MCRLLIATMAVLCLCSGQKTTAEHNKLFEEVRAILVKQVPDLFNYKNVDCVVEVGQDFQQVVPVEFLCDSTNKVCRTHTNNGEFSVRYSLEPYNPEGCL